MINRVVLTGRLTRDVDLRYTQGGAAVATFTLAVDRRFTNQQGEREADFISCVIWRKSAENFANFFHKGSLVGIEGRVQTRNYENQQGQRVYVTEVVVENFSFLEPRSRNNAGNQNQGGNNYGAPVNNAPQNQNQNANPFTSGNRAPQGNPTPSANNTPAGNSSANNGNNGGNTNDPFANTGDSIDISDDDLPF
ncbi:single-stranded DNA-binding protein [Lactobacillus sp. PFC-70]|uniref:single-stranded DNA-binding protein n=1 Tax=Levilactobacillus namurensis TaxID=380393 RepID=UPI000D30FC48|nr:single-stranded DNA-binding protein [Levilactobacillus namurensis]MCW3779119.1 single-stranded DNA-binding protein [Levilactobacillus namurensis]MDT7019897.1 single-stranded DNA-binding protein [Levilactobacillus namurensis]PTM23155.1 single-stranded DNA-binding protein [Lactobacillus sp. PFC-70]WNN65522.1 single-stranded DNA-binding protein [Levilactobacillus namurensis]